MTRSPAPNAIKNGTVRDTHTPKDTMITQHKPAGTLRPVVMAAALCLTLSSCADTQQLMSGSLTSLTSDPLMRNAVDVLITGLLSRTGAVPYPVPFNQ